MLFGEISGSALAGIEAALSRFLKPLLSESDGWGKADTEQKAILLTSLVALCLEAWIGLDVNFSIEKSTV